MQAAARVDAGSETHAVAAPASRADPGGETDERRLAIADLLSLLADSGKAAAVSKTVETCTTSVKAKIKYGQHSRVNTLTTRTATVP